MKKRTSDPWLPAPEYSRTLRGVGLNLLVRDVEVSVAFVSRVLGLEVVYADPDFAVLRHDGCDVVLHADHTYDTHSSLARATQTPVRGAGAELRVYGIDPDAAERRARETGQQVLSRSTDTGHGLRECFLVDPDGYVWVPSLFGERGMA